VEDETAFSIILDPKARLNIAILIGQYIRPEEFSPLGWSPEGNTKENSMQTISRFVPPLGDKHWSFQMRSDQLPSSGEFLAAMQTPVVKAVSPFLQGHSRDWAMVEFWTHDEGAAHAAAEALAKHFDCELRIGNFTRAELGL
jgi:hypothetical protein